MTTTKNYQPTETALQKALGEPDFSQLTEGLGFEYRKSKTGEVYIVDNRVHIRHGGVGDNVYILTPGSIKTLENRLDAEFRNVKVGDWYLGKHDRAWVKCHHIPQPVMPHFCLNPAKVARATYILESQAFIEDTGLKVGDKVQITRTATCREGGWQNSWVESTMAKPGDVGTIRSICHYQGIDVTIPGKLGNYSYPYFVLEKFVEPVKAPEPVEPVRPARRKLAKGVPIQPGDYTGKFENSLTAQAYADKSPLCQGDNSLTYHRVPWTPAEYRSRQEAWVKHFSLKPGRYVKVCATAPHQQDGWSAMWNDRMDDLVGKSYPITGIQSQGIQIKDGVDHWHLPFHVLQPVDGPKTPEPTYRTFKTPVEVSDWVKAHGSVIVGPEYWGKVEEVDMVIGVLRVNGLMAMNSTSYKSDNDGTPFGVKV